MSSVGATDATNLSPMEQVSANLGVSQSTDADSLRRQAGTSPRSEAYAVLCQVLQNDAQQLEARCLKSGAWWMQGALRWKARLRRDLQASRPHWADGKGEGTNRDGPRTQLENDSDLHCHVPSLTCMNGFVLLRRVYGRGHLAKVTSALALTASLWPVALKTYVVHALKRSRTAVFGAEGMHMTNEYEKVRREIVVQSSLQHPNVCPLYGVINDVDTGCLHLVLQLLPYPVMEWVEECCAYSARPTNARHRTAVRSSVTGSVNVLVYTEDAVRGILTQVLDALDYVHSQSIVHKDLKPENLLSTTPPSPGELIMVSVPRVQEAISEEEAFSPERFLAGAHLRQKAVPSPLRPSEPDEEIVARLTNDEEGKSGRGNGLLDELMGERSGCSGNPLGTGDNSDVHLIYRAPSRLGDSKVEQLCNEMPEEVPDWSEPTSFSEETNLSESDSDDEGGVCNGDPHCTCALVAQVPATPAFQTSLAVIENRLSPSAAFLRQVGQDIERSAECDRVTSSESRSHLQTSYCHARKNPLSAAAANGTRRGSFVDSSGSPKLVKPTGSQHTVSSACSKVPAAGRTYSQETTSMERGRRDGGAESAVTIPKSSSPVGETSSESQSPTATARGTGECSAPAGNPRSSGVSITQRLGGVARPSGDTERDLLLTLGQRITMRQRRAGLLRPLSQVIFEGEAHVFPFDEECKSVGKQLGSRRMSERCSSRKRMFLEDVHFAEKACGLPNSHTDTTQSFDRESDRRTVEHDSVGRYSQKHTCEETSTHGRKRCRERSGSTRLQEICSVLESGVSPGTGHADGLKDYVDEVTRLPNPNYDVVTNTRSVGKPASPPVWSKRTGGVLDSSRSARWKLADFSSACVSDDERLTVWDSEGTRHFTPPECLGISCEEGWAGRPRDLWSVGVLLYCLLFGTLPFSGLLCKDPCKRLTAKQVRIHPWLSGVTSDDPERRRQR